MCYDVWITLFAVSSSGDDLRKLNDIVTPPPLLDEAAHEPPGSQTQPRIAVSQDLLSFTPSDEDLNKATNEHLAQKKEEMNLLFEKNRVKPGDEGYIYDKEIDFGDGPKMESGWDTDSSMSDF